MKAAGAEIIFLGNIHKQAALAMKEAAKLGYKPQFISGYIATDPITLELAGEAGDGSIHAGVWKNPEDENDPGVKEYQKIMNKYFPKERFSNATISGVLIAKVTAEAIKRTGKNLTREGLITALENMKNYDTGIAPPISYGPNIRLGYTAVYLYKAKNEKFVYLAGPLTSAK
jgi:branched-chain amino acid transport system substrate-binding protein